MIRKILLILGLLTAGYSTVTAQLYPTQYRPPGIHWQELTTPHFKILFARGEDSVAYKTARILEHEYPSVQQLTGGALSHFPVILTNYNDRSNGIVTSLHFRSEIDISPIKGKSLNPETGGWLQNVVPHELVHALQFSNLGGFGLGRLVNIFSPDFARSLHGATPSGIREGLAVYYESESVVPGGGRGNYPFFANQFDAVFNSPARWSMGQMIHFPDYTRPFNRHYIGGYAFTKWLQETYGPNTSRIAIDFNIRWPFLGYGIALKHATGSWPSELYRQFETDFKNNPEPADSAQRKTPEVLPLPFKGVDIRRPKWLSDSTLIFHGSFYNGRAGFYKYELKTHSLHCFLTTGVISDYRYALTDDRQTLYYSYYRPDILYPNVYKNSLQKFSLTNGTDKVIAKEHRLYSPAVSTDSTLWALKPYHDQSALVNIKLTNQSVSSVFTDPSRKLIAIASHPVNPDSLAMVMNTGRGQSLWLVSKKSLRQDLNGAPEVAFEREAIFDPEWHPSGKRLLFSADFSGTLQVYEYEIATGRITQLTGAPYNAFEASYSPDGNRIAYILQRRNERLPAVLARSAFLNKSSFPAMPEANPDSVTVHSATWIQQPYHAGLSWLKPRAVLPGIEKISGSNNKYRFGAGLHSSDLLQQQAYSLQLTGTKGRLWYDGSYQNKEFFPGFRLRAFNQPALRRFQLDPNNGSEPFLQTFLRQERSIALSVPTLFTFKQNVESTTLFLEPEIRQSQLRYFNREGDNPSDFANASIGNIFVRLNYRLQQNIRDVQPHSGVVLYAEAEHYFRSGSLSLQTQAGESPLQFSKPTAFRSGIFGYISPLRKWNQSLRLGAEVLSQTNPVFDNQSIVSTGFSERIFTVSNNLVSLHTRYTLPVIYPDDGGLLLPLYLSNIYLVGFSDTITDPATGLWNNMRTVFGGGLRLQFRISNLSFDIGAGIGVEPSRQKIHYFIGDF